MNRIEYVEQTVFIRDGMPDYDDYRIDFDNMGCAECGEPIGPRIVDDYETGQPTTTTSDVYAILRDGQPAEFVCADCAETVS